MSTSIIVFKDKSKSIITFQSCKRFLVSLCINESAAHLVKIYDLFLYLVSGSLFTVNAENNIYSTLVFTVRLVEDVWRMPS